MTNDRLVRQIKVANWVEEAFGLQQARSVEYRGLRFVEEAIELAQSCDCKLETLHQLIDHIYSRPKGDLRQELGGVGLTLLALANAAGMSADAAEQEELERVLSKPLEMFKKRNEEKQAALLDLTLDIDGQWVG